MVEHLNLEMGDCWSLAPVGRQDRAAQMARRRGGRAQRVHAAARAGRFFSVIDGQDAPASAKGRAAGGVLGGAQRPAAQARPRQTKGRAAKGRAL